MGPRLATMSGMYHTDPDGWVTTEIDLNQAKRSLLAAFWPAKCGIWHLTVNRMDTHFDPKVVPRILPGRVILWLFWSILG